MNKTLTGVQRMALQWAIEQAEARPVASFAEALRALLAAQQPEPKASAGVIAAAVAVIEADRAHALTDDHIDALDIAIKIQRGMFKLPEPRAEVADSKATGLIKILSDIIHDQTVAMQSAIIEWQHGNGAEAGLAWIVNTLEGPGHLPDFDAPHGKHAQFWFNANQANPLPTCFCGNPSSSLWMGQGFCCDEHYREARAKYDAARAGEGQ